MLIPPLNISVSVDIGIRNFELDNIGIADVGKKCRCENSHVVLIWKGVNASCLQSSVLEKKKKNNLHIFTKHHFNPDKPWGGTLINCHQSWFLYEAIQRASSWLIVSFLLRYTSDTLKCLRSMMQLCLLLDARYSCHPALQTHGLTSECVAATLSTRWATASVQISSPTEASAPDSKFKGSFFFFPFSFLIKDEHPGTQFQIGNDFP